MHVMRIPHPKRWRLTTINLLELPADPGRLLAGLLGLARGRNWIVVNYPREWKRAVQSAWRELLPNLRRNHNHYTSAERVYGKRLQRRGGVGRPG